MQIQRVKHGLSLVPLLVMCSGSTQAGSLSVDFESDPGAVLTVSGRNPEIVRSAGGNPGGYLSLTDAFEFQDAKVIFQDLDKGAVVQGFTFQCDIRFGNGVSDRPGDGFSISFARSDDASLDDTDFRDFASSLPEGGTKTGISISFDSRSGNSLPDGPDVEGLIVRVDNETLVRIPMPTRNGQSDDKTSLQTGPQNGAKDGDPEALSWQPFAVELDARSKLTIRYKGTVYLEGFQTTYQPSKGRFVLAGRTSDANQNAHLDNIKITTELLTGAIIGPVKGSPVGFTLTTTDNGLSKVSKDNLQVKLNGDVVTGAVTKTNGVLRFIYTSATLFPPGSTNTVSVQIQDAIGIVHTALRRFVVGNYTLVPEEFIATSVSGTGFVARMFQLGFAGGPGDPNSIANAETQLSNGFEDPVVPGTPAQNLVNPATAPNGIAEIKTVVNWYEGAPLPFGLFSASNGQEDALIPGLPGILNTSSNVAAAISTFLDLRVGVYRMGVTSSDGFKLSVGPGAQDPFGEVLGGFEGSRNSAESTFDFVVTRAGRYPVRLAWWTLKGPANLEWYVITPEDKKILINDTLGGGVRAYGSGKARAYVKSLEPYPGRTGLAPKPTLKVVLVDDTTKIDPTSIHLEIDGVLQTPTLSVLTSQTLVTWSPVNAFPFGSRHKGVFAYKEIGGTAIRSIALDFTIRAIGVNEFPAGAFSIEAEHFNYDGKFEKSVNTMPYTGNEYAGKGGTAGIDFEVGGSTSDPNSKNYRLPSLYDSNTHSPMYPNLVGINPNGERKSLRGGKTSAFDVTTNYEIGWIDDGTEWYNYTRILPKGAYHVFAAMSHGDTDPNLIRASLSEVTSDPTKPNQTVVKLGSCISTGTGGWGLNAIVQMQNGVAPLVVLSAGAQRTFRFYPEGGDFDWWAFVPVSSTVSADVVTAPGTTIHARDGKLKWLIANLGTKVNATSIRLKLDADSVTPVVNTSDVGAEVLFDLPVGVWGTHQYELTWRDEKGSAGSRTASFLFTPLGTPGTFVVEAEDFNFDGGKTVDPASAAGYKGNGYLGKSATDLVDYHRSDNVTDPNALAYRINETPNVPISDNGADRDRGTVTMDVNYKIDRSGDHWYNYTRTFPAGSYQVWAGLSHGNIGATDIQGKLQLVGGDVATKNQTVTDLGTFQASGTGGWGMNTYVPLKKGNSLVTYTFTGKQTVRTVISSGDFDYLLFVPFVHGDPIASLKATLGSDHRVKIEYLGNLESSPNINGPFIPVSGVGPLFINPTESHRFYRVR